MAEEAHHDELPAVPSEKGVIPPPAVQTLPRVLSVQAAVRMVQHYVEEERRRYRRVLFWTSATLVALIVCAVVVFSAVSMVLLRRMHGTTERLSKLETHAEVSAAEMASAVHNARLAAKSIEEVRSSFRTRESDRIRDTLQLKADLERFARWVAMRTAATADRVAPGDAKLQELQAQIEKTARELDQLKKRYEAVPSTGQKPDESANPGMIGSVKGATTQESAAFNSDTVSSEMLPAGAIKELFARASSSGVPHSGQVPHGQISVLTFRNGDRYEGTLKDGLLHGWGIYYYRNGDRYEGEFKNDLKEGTGTFFFRNGDYYQGQFKDDQINGKGRMFYHDGNRYAGDFRDGLRHGNGTLWFYNGDIYQGEFRDDARTGRGTYIFANGGKYIGEFQEGKRHGHGRYIYPSGEEYLGSFKNGLKDGIGEAVYPDGRRMRGLWKEDHLVKWLEEG
ncbi:MAG: MORN repeat-containing protein [Kiritimatiellia bacterium]